MKGIIKSIDVVTAKNDNVGETVTVQIPGIGTQKQWLAGEGAWSSFYKPGDEVEVFAGNAELEEGFEYDGKHYKNRRFFGLFDPTTMKPMNAREAALTAGVRDLKEENALSGDLLASLASSPKEELAAAGLDG